MTTILTKKKDTTGAPAPGDLTNSAGGAELAVNTFDKRLYTKDSGGNIVEIGTNPSTIDTTTVDTTNLEVTNIKAKDGTASATIANSTGVMTIASAVLTTTDINGGTIDGTTIGGASAAAGNFTTLGASSTATLNTLVSSGATLTGGSINNMAVGASTANTGAFTTLDYTGTLTGGTGVINIGSGQVYKDASGNVGVGTSSPNSKITIGGGGANRISFVTPTNSNYVGYDGSADVLQVATSTSVVFQSGSGYLERMRITSSGDVGIGTTAPDQILHIKTDNTVRAIALLENKNVGSDTDAQLTLKSKINTSTLPLETIRIRSIRSLPVLKFKVSAGTS